jgi:hypothetical protein
MHEFPDGTEPAVIDRVMKEYAQQNVSGVQRMGDLLGQGAKEVESGISELFAPISTQQHVKTLGKRIPAAGMDITGGVATMVGSPVGLVSPYIERGIGIPKEVTEFALPFVAGGGRIGASKLAGLLPGMRGAAASEDVAMAAAKAAPKAPVTPQAKAIETIRYSASLEPKSKQEQVIRDGIKNILTDQAKRDLFTTDQIDKME